LTDRGERRKHGEKGGGEGEVRMTKRLGGSKKGYVTGYQLMHTVRIELGGK
jgi:hypothetical protein